MALLLPTLLGLLLLGACSRCTPDPLPPPRPVHNLVLVNLAEDFPGEIRTADYAGHVQLLIVFRTDDPPSLATIPDWNALQTDYAAHGLAIIGLVVDSRPAAQIAAETATLDAAFPIGLADDQVVAALGGPLAIRAIPTAFLLDRDGQQLNDYPGFVPWPILRADIDAALNNAPLPSLTPDPDPQDELD
jgi:peroxiredoxin